LHHQRATAVTLKTIHKHFFRPWRDSISSLLGGRRRQ
jgi:hypothetical protein